MLSASSRFHILSEGETLLIEGRNKSWQISSSVYIGSENCPKRHQTKEALILLIPGHRYPSDELRDRPPFHCIRIWVPNFQGICFLLSLSVLAITQCILATSLLLTLSHKVKPLNTVMKPFFNPIRKSTWIPERLCASFRPEITQSSWNAGGEFSNLVSADAGVFGDSWWLPPFLCALEPRESSNPCAQSRLGQVFSLRGSFC